MAARTTARRRETGDAAAGVAQGKERLTPTPLEIAFVDTCSSFAMEADVRKPAAMLGKCSGAMTTVEQSGDPQPRAARTALHRHGGAIAHRGQRPLRTAAP